jgi:hypothetical protein
MAVKTFVMEYAIIAVPDSTLCPVPRSENPWADENRTPVRSTTTYRSAGVWFFAAAEMIFLSICAGRLPALYMPYR